MWQKFLYGLYHIFSFFKVNWFDRWLLPHVSCVVIENKQGQVLAVSRKDDLTLLGLPGGKKLCSETDVSAAHRECLEETGISVPSWCLTKIFEKNDNHGYWVTTYYACLSYVPPIGADATPESLARVVWTDWSTLTSSVFGEYNSKLFTVLNKSKAEECLFCGHYHG